MNRFWPLLIIFLLAGWNLPGGTLALFRTPFGDIEVELLDQDKPVTVRNFIRYVQSGAYRNMFLHRCEPNFVIQGGGFMTTNRTETGLASKFFYVPNFGKITNEFNAGSFYSNVYGTLAMAKIKDDPNSASSQWFFNLTNNSANLDNQNGGFTVFGRVVRGTNVLEVFNSMQAGAGWVDMTYWYGAGLSVLSRLPVSYLGYTPPNFEDLIYADIALLAAQLRALPGGAWEITWNSVSNKVNHIEVATNVPPVWHMLTSTNGTGESLQFIDSTSAGPVRLYRIRVDY